MGNDTLTTIREQFLKNDNLKNFSVYAIRLIEGFVDNKLSMVNYVRSDNTSQIITLLCIYNFLLNKSITVDNIIKTVPHRIASRSHAISTLNKLCKKEILIKQICSKDKRSKIILPSVKLLEEYQAFFIEKIALK